MTQGAIVLRTPVGGHNETVSDQINGFIITTGIVELAEKLVKLADRKLTPDSKFLNMMLESKALIEPHIGAGYSSLVKRILGR
jgi:glycosyltransferase involved in cell wall biosynthesis